MGSVAQFAEERLQDSMENRNPVEHLVDGFKNLAISSSIIIARKSGSTLASPVWNKAKIAIRTSNKLKPPLELVEDETCKVGKNTEHITGGKRNGSCLPKKDNGKIELANWRRHGKRSCSYQPLNKGRPSLDEPGSFVSHELKDCNIISKMIVGYILNGREAKQEVTGSEKCVTIPSTARRVEMRFKAMPAF